VAVNGTQNAKRKTPNGKRKPQNEDRGRSFFVFHFSFFVLLDSASQMIVQGARPADWLMENLDLLPDGGRALDVACGRGRHALALAAAGFTVTAIDRNEDALAELSARAAQLRLPIHTRALDLEAGAVDVGEGYQAVLVFRYLHRPLMPVLIRALAPGGVLFYETFTIGQARRGHPTNPAFLLNPGELVRLVAPLIVERSREGDVDGALVASVVARRAQTT
jgi:SAM-dependent methyltransferase